MSEIVKLQRNTRQLASEEYDLLIVGGGIFGASAAWDAALRGYKVALVEQNDFGSGVSANSYKIVHGGIRYIQHMDIARVRSSCHERSTFLKIAPHLVHPLPIAIPTYGYGMSGKPVLAIGTLLYDILTADRNRSITDDNRQVPWANRLSKAEILKLFPGLDANGLTGAVQFSDAQMYNPPRLVLAFLQSAASKGASVCNYAQVTGFDTSGDSVVAANVVDTLSGDAFKIRARAYLNAAGPWTDALLNEDSVTENSTPGVYSRDACFVVPRRFEHDISVAIMGQTKDPDALMSRPARHLFVVPWREYSLVGTWHKVVPATPDKIGIDQSEIEEYIAEVHAAYPELNLTADDVTMCNWGLVPFGEEQKGGENLSYGKRSILVDHAKRRGPANLISLVGIRYTMGRGDAEWAMQAVAKKLGDDRPAPGSDQIRLHGGDIDDMDKLVSELQHSLPDSFDDNVGYSLARNYGSTAKHLVDAGSPELVGSSHIIKAQISHAVDYEMAQTVSDVILRRTDLGSGGSPGEESLRDCAEIAGTYLGLSSADIDSQLDEVRARIPGWDKNSG